MKDQEFTIEMSDQVRQQMEADPKMAAALREFMANCRQANEAVQAGRYTTFEEAIAAITGHRPERVDLDDE